VSKVFVSYKRENVAAVARVVQALRQEGVDVWWDLDIPPDAAWEQTIERELSRASVVVVAWSLAAVDSENVKAEARWARRNRRLLQIYVEPCEPPLFFGERQGVDLTDWSGATSSPPFRLLLDAVREATDTVRPTAPQTDETTAAARSALVAPGDGRSVIFPEGTVLNGLFEVRRLLGFGSVADGYEGVNVTTRERVAIKAFRPEVGDLPVVRDGLLREMHVLARLGHPAIAPYRLAAREPASGAIYVVSDFVDGIALDALVGEVTLTEAKLRMLTRRLAEGLSSAHALGVIHRELTAEHVMAPNGRLEQCKIVDFGLSEKSDLQFRAARARAGAPRGYAAPEQFGEFGGEVGPWTDVYGLGLVMAALATGVRPGGAPVPPGADSDRPSAGYDLSHAPRGLRGVFAQMLAPDPKVRLRSMEAVLSALEGKPSRGRRLAGTGRRVQA